MKELIEQLEQKTADFLRDARSQLDKGNKAAGLRARRTSLEMEPLLKQFRRKTERLTVRECGIIAYFFE